MTQIILASVNAKIESRRLATNEWCPMTQWNADDSRMASIASYLQLRGWRNDPDFRTVQVPYVNQD